MSDAARTRKSVHTSMPAFSNREWILLKQAQDLGLAAGRAAVADRIPPLGQGSADYGHLHATGDRISDNEGHSRRRL